MDNSDQCTVVKCSHCRTVIGKIETVEGLDLLQIGSQLVRYTHGFCQVCGTEFHWSLSDRMLQKMVEKKAGSK